MQITALPDHARVWIYQSSRAFTPDENNWLHETCRKFVDEWSSHGRKLAAAYEIAHGRFIILAVDEDQADASGCSIDKSVHLVRDIENTLKISLTGRTEIAYLDEKNELHTFNLNDAGKFFESGKLDGQTRFFNNLVASKEDWEKNWITPVEGSWLERFVIVKTT